MIQVQISYYPLNGEVNYGVQRFIAELGRFNLEMEVGNMSTIVYGSSEEVWNALRSAYEAASEGIPSVMNLTVTNACPLPSYSINKE
jgi:uncharacterized protein YqgV (UPF0045/DUF77 family)